MGISGSLCHRERSVANSKIRFFLGYRHVASLLAMTFSIGDVGFQSITRLFAGLSPLTQSPYAGTPHDAPRRSARRESGPFQPSERGTRRLHAVEGC